MRIPDGFEPVKVVVPPNAELFVGRLKHKVGCFLLACRLCRLDPVRMVVGAQGPVVPPGHLRFCG